MESSSYSKTRSPARFLAAFLAVVMLFIFMPVMPVGAATVAVTTVIFDNVVDYPDGNNFQNTDVFYSDLDETVLVEEYLDEQNASIESWKGTTGTITATGQRSENKVTLTIEGGQFVGYEKRKNISFSFKVFNPSTEKNVQFRCGSSSEWKTLTATNGEYTITPGDCGDVDTTTIEIRAIIPPKTHTVSFTGDGVSSWSAKLDGVPALNGAKLTVEEKESYDLVISNVPQSEKPDIHADTEVQIDEVGDPTPDKNTPPKYTYTYKIKELKSDTVLTISKAENNVKLQFNQSSNPHFDVDVPGLDRSKTEISVNDVVKGGDYTFTITRDEAYKEPTVTITKTAVDDSSNWTNFTKTTNGLSTVYKLYGVDQDLSITITDGGKMQSAVEFHLPEGAMGEGVTVDVGGKGSNVVESLDYGTHEIKITIPVSYSDSVVSATVNGVAVKLTLDGASVGNGTKVYKGNINVNSPTTVIVVNGVQKNTYTVTVAASMKYVVQGASSSSVAYAGNVTFTLLLNEGYEMAKGCVVNMNGIKLEYPKERYNLNINDRIVIVTIYDIQESGEISFAEEGISLKKLTVAFDDGGDKFHINYSLPEPDKKVTYGEGVTFDVTPGNGYRIKSVYWTNTKDGANDVRNEISLISGKYSLANVTADRYVHVEAEPINYTLNLHATRTTTTFDKQLDAKQDGEVFTITFNAETDNETLKKIFTLQDNGCEIDFGKLNKMITRPGYSLKHWENTQNAQVNDKWLMQNSVNRADVTVTFEPEWTINMETGGDGKGKDEGFFTLLMETFQYHGSNNKTTLRAKILTNLQPADQDGAGGVEMVAHGFLYANSDKNMNSATQDSAALMKKLKDVSGDANGSVNWLDGYTSKVLYYKRSAGDSGKQMFDEGRYSVTLTGTEYDENFVAVAWVIVKIDGQEYLFLSEQKKLDK